MPTTRLAAIMFTDIVGYTAMMQTNRESAMTAVKDFEAVLKDRIASHSGELLQTYGDGSLSVFDSASAAVSCAKEIQEAIRGKVPLRIGIHLGEITIDGDHTFGDGVNIASRIESMGTAGAVLMSSSICQQIKNKPEFQLESLGKFAFKNVAEPMSVYALGNEGFSIPKKSEMQGKGKALSGLSTKMMIRLASLGFLAMVLGAGIFWMMSAGQKEGAVTAWEKVRASRIAILPFENLTNDPDLEVVGQMAANWIADGLISIEDLKVVSSGNVRSQLQSSPHATNEQFAKATGADKLIVGSIYRSGDNLILKSNVEDPYEGDAKVVFPEIRGKTDDPTRLVEQLMQHILTYYTINMDNNPSMVSRLKAGPPKLAAFQAFTEGLKEFSIDYDASLRHFRKAQEIDPQFMLPYWWSISCYTNRGRLEEADSVLSVIKNKFTSLNHYEKLYIEWIESTLSNNLEERYRTTHELLKLDPGDATNTYLASLSAFALNRPKESFELLKPVINLESWGDDPAATKANVDWGFSLGGEALIRLNRLQEARKIIRSIPPAYYNTDLQMRLAKIAIRLQETDSLDELIEDAILNGNIAPIYAEAGKTYGLLGQKDQQELWYRKAMDWYKDQAKKSSMAPTAPASYYQYGGFPEKALARFQELQKTSTSKAYWAKLYYLKKIGILFAQLERTEEAEEIIRQLEDIRSPYPAVLARATYARACILAQLDEKIESVQALKKAFSQGYSFNTGGTYYADLDLLPLHGFPAYEDFVKPRD